MIALILAVVGLFSSVALLITDNSLLDTPVAESWVNGRATLHNRGRLLANLSETWSIAIETKREDFPWTPSVFYLT